MDKYVLIDGNSLLNRAYYAISPFNTKDGLPTNGIFGFIKLLFKILEDEKPDYLSVAFDVHAPTFRHKMFDGYKATRKPMPEDLAVQVPILKDLLAAMRIHTVELAGYEADDLIGTLSRKFGDLDVLIYTGDRDAYQLVNDHVTVCFTKRGVTVTDKLTGKNFYETVGLYPEQIIEEKSLMGDTADNIPGVKGIGPKTTLELLRQYGTCENVFLHLEELPAKVKSRFEGSEEIARLSHALATINTQIPLDLTKEDCRVQLPLPEAARDFFARLEFRSLMDSAFFSAASDRPSCETVFCDDPALPLKALETATEFAADFGDDGFHLAVLGREYILPLKTSLLGSGFFAEELEPLLHALFEGDRRAYVVDLKAFCHRLDEYGIEPTCPMEDVSLLRYLSDSNRRASTAMGFVQDYNMPETQTATATLRAFKEAQEKTAGTAEERLYRTLELPLAHVLLDMERTGVCVDAARFPEFAQKYETELSTLSARIYELAGVDSFNINSPFQLSEILFEKLGFDTKGIKKINRGGYSTNADVLEKLAREHEIARYILRYREVQKLRSTYIDGIRPLIVDGVVHTTYNQTMTTTGRLSSANPNLQNIPIRREEGRELRKLFVAREGNILIDADYSQIELRLLAHFSGCKPLQEAYREGRDIHTATAAQVFGVSVDEVTPLMRRKAKAVNFGIIYGISAFGLSSDIGCSTAEAQAYIDKYFETYSSVKEYMEGNVAFAKQNGYVTTILGRKRYIPELKAANFNMRAFGERAAMNMPLQGSSADIIKLAMLGVSRRLKAEGLKTKMVLQVHDELVLDAPLEEQEIASRILKEEMEGAIKLNVPLVADVSAGMSWYDAK